MSQSSERSNEKETKQFSQERRKIGLSLVVAALVVVLDQLSKSWVRGNLPPTNSFPDRGFLDLVYIENYGSAFGLFANQTFLLIVITLASLLTILLFLHFLSPTTTLNVVSLSLILGGAVGNLIDRLRFGCVTDFIYFHIHSFFRWPAFNLADTAIVIGIFVLIYSLYSSGLFRKAYEHEHKTKG
jgi:lipoprotein signal peptidase